MKTACDLLTQLDEEVLVNPSDWRRGTVGTDDGPKCLVGALNFCTYGTTVSPTAIWSLAYRAARDALVQAIKRECLRPHSLVTFNDYVAQDFTEVKRVVRQAREEVCE